MVPGQVVKLRAWRLQDSCFWKSGWKMNYSVKTVSNSNHGHPGRVEDRLWNFYSEHLFSPKQTLKNLPDIDNLQPSPGSHLLQGIFVIDSKFKLDIISLPDQHLSDPI